VSVPAKPPPHYWVYVIELDQAALADRDQGEVGQGAVYVGYTSKAPEQRLKQHQTGVKAGKVFKRMSDPLSSRLRTDLSLYAGPYESEADARRNEKRTHNRLLSDGYKVFGDRGKRLGVRRRVG